MSDPLNPEVPIRKIDPRLQASFKDFTTHHLQMMPFSDSFRVSKNTLISVESSDDFIRNELMIRVEAMIATDHIVDESYRGYTQHRWPASTWQMFKKTHESSWWLGWLVRRREVKFHTQTASVDIEVGRYLYYPDAVIQSYHLGRPLILEQVKQVRP